MFGFKRTPPSKVEAFASYTVGEEVLYGGRVATITSIDYEDTDPDGESMSGSIPEMHLYYCNDVGDVRRVALSPRDVLDMVRHK